MPSSSATRRSTASVTCSASSPASRTLTCRLPSLTWPKTIVPRVRGDRRRPSARSRADELGQATGRHRHVELHRHALGADGLGVLLAVGPQRPLAGGVGGDVGVEQALGLADRLDEVVGRVGRVGALEQQVGRVLLGERRRQPAVLAHQRQAVGEQQLGGREVRQPRAQPGQHRDGRCRRRAGRAARRTARSAAAPAAAGPAVTTPSVPSLPASSDTRS